MLHKIGLSDVTAGLWSRRLRLLLAGVTAGVVGAVYALLASGYLSPDINVKDRCYLQSVTLYIESTQQLDVDILTLSLKTRNAYMTSLRSDLFADYLIDQLPDTDLTEVLLENPSASSINVSVPDSRVNQVANAFSYISSNDVPTLRVSFYCYNKDIGENIIDRLMDYATEQIKISSAVVREVGRTSFLYEKNSAPSRPSKTQVRQSMIKAGIGYLLICELLYTLGIFVFISFRPAVNRKSDIGDYTSASVWDILPRTKSSDCRYIARRIWTKAQSSQNKTVLFSCPSARSTQAKNNLLSRLLKEFQNTGLRVRVLSLDDGFTPPPDTTAAAYPPDDFPPADMYRLADELTDECDLVLINLPPLSTHAYLLDEKPGASLLLHIYYGKTLYRDFERTLERLAEIGIPLAGITASYEKRADK